MAIGVGTDDAMFVIMRLFKSREKIKNESSSWGNKESWDMSGGLASMPGISMLYHNHGQLPVLYNSQQSIPIFGERFSDHSALSQIEGKFESVFRATIQPVHVETRQSDGSTRVISAIDQPPLETDLKRRCASCSMVLFDPSPRSRRGTGLSSTSRSNAGAPR